MDYRRANRAYLYMIIATIVMELMLTLWMVGTGTPNVSVFITNLLCELVVLVPAISAVLYSGDSLGSVIPLKRFKLSSALLSIVFMFTLVPLTSLLNAISMLFVNNVVSEISPEVVEMPMWLMVLTIGVISPFVEEVVFRGVIFQTYKKGGRILVSAILSSLLFGMMHMNFNQLAYAAVLGVMFCLLAEATGSVLSTFLIHGVFNSLQVVYLYLSRDILVDTAATEEVPLLYSIAILLVLAIIFTPISIGLVYKISKIEGREEAIRKFFKGDKKEGHLISFPLIVAMGLCIAFMVVITVSTR